MDVKISKKDSPADFIKSMPWQIDEKAGTLFLTSEDHMRVNDYLKNKPVRDCEDFGLLVSFFHADGYSPTLLSDGRRNTNGKTQISYDDMDFRDDGSIKISGDTAATMINFIKGKKTTEAEAQPRNIDSREFAALPWRTKLAKSEEGVSFSIDKSKLESSYDIARFSSQLKAVYGDGSVLEDKHTFTLKGEGAQKFKQDRSAYVSSVGSKTQKVDAADSLKKIGATERNFGAFADRA